VPNFTKDVSLDEEIRIKFGSHPYSESGSGLKVKQNTSYLIRYSDTKNNTKISQQNNLLSAYLVWN